MMQESQLQANTGHYDKENSHGPFHYYGLTLIPAWTSNYIHYKVWDKFIYPFLNFNGATVEI